MSHAYTEDPMTVFQKAEAAPKDGLVTLSTTWWMRCPEPNVGQNGVKNQNAWVVVRF